MKAHQIYFAVVMMVLSVMLASMTAWAQADLELTCRAKAKEVALEFYQGCMTEGRTQKINSIREEYKSELSALKSKYEGMLKEMKTTDKAALAPKKTETPTKGVARQLPAKTVDNGPALPIQSESNMVGVTEESF